MANNRITPAKILPQPMADKIEGTVCINGETLTFAELSERYPGWHMRAPTTNGVFICKPSARQYEVIKPSKMN